MNENVRMMKMSLQEMLAMVQGWQRASAKMRQQFLAVQGEMTQSMRAAGHLAYGESAEDLGSATGSMLQRSADQVEWVVDEMKKQEELIRRVASDFAEKQREIDNVGGDMMRD